MSTQTLKQNIGVQSKIQGIKRSFDSVDNSDSEFNYDDARIYPVFSTSEKEQLVKLRRQAWSMRPYLGLCRLQAIHEEEVRVGNIAMESDNDPFQAVYDHWLYAIEMGNKYMEHHITISKVWTAANRLIESGLETHAQMMHFINLAGESDKQGIDLSIMRLLGLIREFNEAFYRGTNVCMCKEKVCCCRI
jgi:hypothetical protein